MNTTNINSLWSAVMADELAKNGLDCVCLSPGSRNTPLTVALTRHESIRVLSHLDERASAFFALGRSRQTGSPTALVCTSGTAAAEYHPAVLESYHDRVPLLILTADRPPELTDSGANQTVDQQQLYGSATRWFRSIPEPEAAPRTIRSLRTTLCRAHHRARTDPAGPVHLNVPFRKPLEPGEEPHPELTRFAENHPREVDGRSGPYVRIETDSSSPATKPWDDVRDEIKTAETPLLHLGPLPTYNPDRIAEIVGRVSELNLPVLVNSRSGFRYHAGLEPHGLIAGYDGFLPALEGLEQWESDLVVQAGCSPNAANGWMDYLDRSGGGRILVAPGEDVWPDQNFDAHRFHRGNPLDLLESLHEHQHTNNESNDWLDRWREVDRRWWTYLEDALPVTEDSFFEGQVLRDLLEHIPDPSNLFVGNSTPIRDLLRYTPVIPKTIHVLANRGASGIDGQISTTAGIASRSDNPVIGVLGDVGFYHDVNGLLAFRRHDLDGVLVLINNNGGGIFHKLPIETVDPPFEEYVKTPHDLDFEAAASLFDAHFYSSTSRDDFRTDLEKALEEPGLSVVEVQTDAEHSQRLRESLREEFRDRIQNDF